jgi:DHA1 family multidrug/chloramphenicol efflux transport protein-like MFS transporter
MYLPALPAVMHDLHISHHLAQLTLTLWFLGSASMQLILGPLSDRFGRRPILLSGAVFFILATFICAVSNDIHWLLLARFIQGSAVCSISVAGYATIHEMLDHKAAIKTIAWMNSITILAPALGPLCGGYLLKLGDWHVIFWLLLTVALITFIGLLKFMPESLTVDKKQPIKLSQLLQNYSLIIKNTGFSLRILAGCLLFMLMIIWITASPFLIIQQYQYSTTAFGWFQAAVFTSYVIGTRLTGILINYYNATTLIRGGFMLTLGGSLLAVIAAYIVNLHLVGFIALFMLTCVGIAMVGTPLQRLAIEASPLPNGLKMAVSATGFGSFGVLGSMLASLVYQQSLAYIASLFALVTLLAAVVYRRAPS